MAVEKTIDKQRKKHLSNGHHRERPYRVAISFTEDEYNLMKENADRLHLEVQHFLRMVACTHIPNRRNTAGQTTT